MQSLSPRLVLITDGRIEFSLKEIVQAVEGSKFKNRVRVDVIAVGMKPIVQDAYASLAKTTCGEFLEVDQPNDRQPGLTEYLQVLRTPRPEPIQLVGQDANYRILPGDEAKLRPGSYSCTSPDMAGLDSLKRTIQDVNIASGASGEKTILGVRMQEGQLVVGVNRH